MTANHLVPILQGAQGASNALAVDHATEAIEAERMQEIRPIQRLQAQPPRLVLSRAWYGEPLRRIAGTLMQNARVRSLAGKNVAPFFYGVSDVRLRV